MRGRRILAAMPVVGGLCLLYGPIGRWWIERLGAPDSYYAHGFLVPFVAGWIIWRRRGRLAATTRCSRGWGFVLLAAGLLLATAGARVSFPEARAFSLPLVLGGVIWFAWGGAALRVLLVPVVFLYFMVPAPVFLLARMTQALKLAAVTAGISVVDLLGVSASAQGSFVLLEGGGRLLVGDPCSGMRSLIALVALAFLLAFEFSRQGWTGRLVLILAATPLAFASNVVRIAVLCFSASHLEGRVPGWLHDAAGVLVYALALGGLMLVDRVVATAGRKGGRWVPSGTP